VGVGALVAWLLVVGEGPSPFGACWVSDIIIGPLSLISFEAHAGSTRYNLIFARGWLGPLRNVLVATSTPIKMLGLSKANVRT